jgi:hypothetical protein
MIELCFGVNTATLEAIAYKFYFQKLGLQIPITVKIGMCLPLGFAFTWYTAIPQGTSELT